MAYLQTIEFTGKVSTDQTGRFPVTFHRGIKYPMVLYDHDSNAILAEPLTSRRNILRPPGNSLSSIWDWGGEAMVREVVMEDVGGYYEFTLITQVEWLR